MAEIIAVIVDIVIAGFALVGIIVNTRAIQEKNELSAEMADIEREFYAYGPNPTDEQLEAISVRLGQFGQRFDTFKCSPFVRLFRRTDEPG